MRENICKQSDWQGINLQNMPYLIYVIYMAFWEEEESLVAIPLLEPQNNKVNIKFKIIVLDKYGEKNKIWTWI